MDGAGESSGAAAAAAAAAGGRLQGEALGGWGEELRAWLDQVAQGQGGGAVAAGGDDVASTAEGGGGGAGAELWVQEHRLGKLIEEAKTAVEFSIRHQEALWQIFVFNSGQGPYPLVSPALMPNLQAKLDTSMDFCSLALECLQEVRGLLLLHNRGQLPLSHVGLPGFELGAYPGAGWEAPLVQHQQQHQQREGSFKIAVSSSQDQAPECSPSKVRPCTPLAPLQVPLRPDAYRTTAIDHPGQPVSERLTPTIYTAYRGGSSRAMSTPTCEIMPLVPPSIVASDFAGSSTMAVRRGEDPAGFFQGLGDMIADFFPAPSQPNRSWLDISDTSRSRSSPDRTEQEQQTPPRPQRGRQRPTATRAAQPRIRNPLGDRRRMTLQPGADPERDIPEDGFTWRKYGQKRIRNSVHERGYYRCNQPDDLHAPGGTKQSCKAKKQVQRSDHDSSVFDVYYRGQHTCSHGRCAAARPVLHPQPRYPITTLAAMLQATANHTELPRLQFGMDTDSESSTGDFLLDAEGDPPELPPFSMSALGQTVLDEMTSLLLA